MKINYIKCYFISMIGLSQVLLTQDYEFRIINGESVYDYSEYAGLVSISYNNPDTTLAYNHWCGGALIAPDWILTAAHCAEEYPIDSLLFIIGTTILSDTVGGEIEILTADTVFIHEHVTYPPDTTQYSWAHGNDIALFHLIDASQNITIPINLDTLLIETSDTVTAIGWGNFEGGDPDTLQKADFTILDSDTCTAWVYALYSEWNVEEYSNFDSENLICFIDSSNQQSTSAGDSGGPLIVYDANGHGHTTGIASRVFFGSNNPMSNINTIIYTNIIKYKSWIDSTMDANNIIISNRSIVGAQYNLGGSLQIDNLYWSINSGDTLQISPLSPTAPSWVVRTQNKAINDTLVHYNWNTENSEYLLVHETRLDLQSEETAYFRTEDSVYFSTNLDSVLTPIDLHDPWYAYEENGGWIQPDEFRPLNELTTTGGYAVFLDQGGYNINDLTPPYYSLRAPIYVTEGSDTFMFDVWSEETGDVSFNELAPETPVVFHQPGAEITANYVQVSSINQDFTIPPGFINMISFNVLPDNPAIESIFAGISNIMIDDDHGGDFVQTQKVTLVK